MALAQHGCLSFNTPQHPCRTNQSNTGCSPIGTLPTDSGGTARSLCTYFSPAAMGKASAVGLRCMLLLGVAAGVASESSQLNQAVPQMGSSPGGHRKLNRNWGSSPAFPHCKAHHPLSCPINSSQAFGAHHQNLNTMSHVQRKCRRTSAASFAKPKGKDPSGSKMMAAARMSVSALRHPPQPGPRPSRRLRQHPRPQLRPRPHLVPQTT